MMTICIPVISPLTLTGNGGAVQGSVQRWLTGLARAI